MGKVQKFKKLRRIASTLPLIQVRSAARERVRGADLIKKGVREVKGVPVEPNRYYMQASPVALNHYRNMKKVYYKAGLPGAARYAQAVVDHSERKVK